MEHIMENKFLNKESAQRVAFNEEDEKLKLVEQYSQMSVDEAQF